MLSNISLRSSSSCGTSSPSLPKLSSVSDDLQELSKGFLNKVKIKVSEASFDYRKTSQLFDRFLVLKKSLEKSLGKIP